jgi:hypothetical protein
MITNPIHPLFGQSVTVRGIRQLGATIQISVNHPDGGTLSLPASETSFESRDYLISSPLAPLLEVQKLLDLTDWITIHNLKSSASSIPVASKTEDKFEDGKVVHSEHHASSTSPSHRSLRRSKRRAAATD